MSEREIIIAGADSELFSGIFMVDTFRIPDLPELFPILTLSTSLQQVHFTTCESV